MEYLVKKGVPLKDAHDIVGKIMLYCEDKGLNINETPLNKLRSFSPKFNRDIYKLLDAKHSVSLKKSYGSTNPKKVIKEVKNA